MLNSHYGFIIFIIYIDSPHSYTYTVYTRVRRISIRWILNSRFQTLDPDSKIVQQKELKTGNVVVFEIPSMTCLAE